MPSVSITLKFDRRIWGNPAVQRTVWNAAKMVRDLWLARSPNLSGEYAKGLMHQASVVVRPGEIVVTNMAEHAAVYEYGHKAFNWGLAFLRSGSGKVKRAKDGSKYAIIKIDPKGRSAFRKPSVAGNVIAAFRGTVPRGRTKFSAYEGVASMTRYEAQQRLRKRLKPKAALQGAMRGYFVVSEKAIKADPKKWFHAKTEGYRLARDVKREAQPIVERAIAQVVAAEAARKARETRRR